MKNKPLKTIFHIDETEYENVYLQRIESPYTLIFDIESRADSRKKKYPMFTCITKEMMLLSDHIHELAIRLERVIRPIPPIAIKQFFMSCLKEEIQATNDIEGVHSTRKEIDLAIEQQQSPKNKFNVRLWGIVNKYQKLSAKEDIPFNSCQDLRNFYDDFVLDEVIKDDSKNKPDGILFRVGQVSVSDGIKDMHTGLYPESVIIETMEKALAILNDEEIPRLIRISIYHYLFGYIHPFYDGNGRTSRFVTSYFLTKSISALLGVRLSITIKKEKRAYYKLFEETNSLLNRGELTDFILGFMQIIEKALSETISILENKYQKYARYSKCLKKGHIRKQDLPIYNVLLQAALFSDEMGATVKAIAVTLRRHENTIQRNLQRLQEDTNHIIAHKAHKAYRYELNLAEFSLDCK